MNRPIQKYNFFYAFFRPLAIFGTHCHYRRLIIKGHENLPTDGPFIFAPCHQNALMEPLLLLSIRSIHRVVFLARADIFQNPTIHKILSSLKILPVYRIRDGKDNLGKNVAIFEQSSNVLMDGTPLCLMAEGKHNNQHHLLPLVKGMFRIAGETQKRLGNTPLYILPTGIDFDEYERPYSNAVVNVGKPIPIQPFMEEFNKNEAVALNQMRDALQGNLLPLMHDIRHTEYYDELYTLCNACNRTFRKENGMRNTAWNRFKARQHISNRLDAMITNDDEKAGAIIHLGKEYLNICNELKMNPKIPSERWNLFELLLSTVIFAGIIVSAIWIRPIAIFLLFWLLCYPISWLPTHLIIHYAVKDSQFRSSFNCAIRFVLSMIYVITFTIIIGVHHGLIWAIISFIMAFVIAFCNRYIVCWIRSLFRNWKYRFIQLFHHEKTEVLDAIVKEVSQSMKG